jgi:hypothetical protein
VEETPVTNETTDKKAASPAVDAQLLAELVKRAQADGVSLTGEGGLLAQLTKVVLESRVRLLHRAQHRTIPSPRHHPARSPSSTTSSMTRADNPENTTPQSVDLQHAPA